MSEGDGIFCGVTSMCPLPRLQFSANSVHRKRRFGGTDVEGSAAVDEGEDAVGEAFEAK